MSGITPVTATEMRDKWSEASLDARDLLPSEQDALASILRSDLFYVLAGNVHAMARDAITVTSNLNLLSNETHLEQALRAQGYSAGVLAVLDYLLDAAIDPREGLE